VTSRKVHSTLSTAGHDYTASGCMTESENVDGGMMKTTTT